MSGAADTPAPPRRGQRGWWLLGAVALGLPLAAAIVLWWWCRSTADLDAVAAEMRAMHLPASDAEWGRAPARAERIAMRDRAETLAKALDTYRNDAFPVARGTPLPDGFLEFQRSRDPAAVAELETLLLDLGDQPVATAVEAPLNGAGEPAPYHALRFLRQRLTAGLDGGERTACAALTLLRGQEGARRLAAQWSLAQLLRAVAYRRGEGTVFTAALADALDATARQALAQYPRDVAAMAILDLRAYRRGLDFTSMTLGIAMPAIMEVFPLGQIIFRGGRRGVLQDELAWAVFARDHPRFDQWLRHGADLGAARSARPGTSPYGILRRSLPAIHADQSVLKQWGRTLLLAQLLAAEIRHGPWPADLFSPTGAPLRPVVEDGSIVGAASVGVDGVDDAGVGDDLVLTLHPPSAPAAAK